MARARRGTLSQHSGFPTSLISYKISIRSFIYLHLFENNKICSISPTIRNELSNLTLRSLIIRSSWLAYRITRTSTWLLQPKATDFPRYLGIKYIDTRLLNRTVWLNARSVHSVSGKINCLGKQFRTQTILSRNVTVRAIKE